jgi:hypothetical protein
VTEVREGDYVKVGEQWKVITANPAYGVRPLPRRWYVTTADGTTYGMSQINRYAKRADLEL